MHCGSPATPPGVPTRSRRSAPSSSATARSSARASTEAGGRHAEVVALAAAGERARGATLFATLEPCSHWGTTPPCTDARARRRHRAGRGRRRATRIPRRPAVSRRCAPAGSRSSSSIPGRRACRTRPGASWVSAGRPFVTYKAAVSLDGRVVVPGRRWVSGDASRRLVHELRAGVRCRRRRHGDRARRRAAPRRARRPDAARAAAPPRVRARARCRPAPSSSSAPARSRTSSQRSPPRASSRCSSKAARRSPARSSRRISSTSCSSSRRPCWRAATGRRSSPRLGSPRPLIHLGVRMVGEDVLLEAYVREP